MWGDSQNFGEGGRVVKNARVTVVKYYEIDISNRLLL